jgi:hypothetical protein
MRIPQTPKATLLLAILCALAIGLTIFIPVLIVAMNEAKPTKTLAPKHRPPVVRRRNEEEEGDEKTTRDKHVPISQGFLDSDFIKTAQWLSCQEKKTALTSQVQGLRVNWIVEVNSVNSFGVSFRLKNGVGVATVNEGFYERIQPHTTTFRQGNDWIKHLKSGERVKLSGEVSDIVNTIGVHSGYYFIIKDFTISRLDELTK